MIINNALRWSAKTTASMTVIAALFLGKTSLATNQPLKIYTWLRYVDPVLITEFEQLYDVTVKFSYFDSNDSRDKELAFSAGRGYDILILNGQQLPRYHKQGWLARLTEQDVPNRRHIDERWTKNLGETSQYAIAYFWGTMGIGYRQEYFPEGINSWQQLMQPEERIRGKLVMPNFIRALVAIALKSRGRSANTTDTSLIVAAGKQIMAQKNYVSSYDYTALDATSQLVTGAAWAGVYYNGDFLMMQQHDDNIRYSIPKEGALLWIDYMAVAQSSDNKAMAFKFLDFINRPDIAARQSLYLRLASANSLAQEHLPAEFLANPIIFPDEAILDRSEFLQALPPRSQKQVNIIGNQVFH